MGLQKDDILKSILDLGKTAQELEGVKKEIEELKQVKGQLDHEVALLKKTRIEENDLFSKEQIERKAKKEELEKAINELQNHRSSLSNSAIPELLKLQNLKDSIDSGKVTLDNQQERLNAQVNQHSKNQQELEDKKEILKQIKELTEKL